MTAHVRGIDFASSRSSGGAAAMNAQVHSFTELVTALLGERVEVHDFSSLGEGKGGVIVLRGSARAAELWPALVAQGTSELHGKAFDVDPEFPPLYDPGLAPQAAPAAGNRLRGAEYTAEPEPE